MSSRSLRGSLLLLLASAIWGAAFAFQRMGMDSMGPHSFNGVRMLLGAAVLQPVIMLLDRTKKNAAPSTPEAKRRQRKAGLICGAFLFVASALQQVGLITTTAGKAGFITALYVVLVPVAAWLLFRKNPGRIVWIGVLLALVALFLLCVPAGEFTVQTGDLLVLGCAFCFTGQILAVDHYAPLVDGVRLSRDEFLVTGVLSMIVALCTETITWEGIRAAMIPLLYAGVLSSGAGYTLQILGQRDTNPTVASLIMCLESVFATLTGALILGERMSGRELWGCVLMFAAVILAQLSPVITASLRRGGRFRR